MVISIFINIRPAIFFSFSCPQLGWGRKKPVGFPQVLGENIKVVFEKCTLRLRAAPLLLSLYIARDAKERARGKMNTRGRESAKKEGLNSRLAIRDYS